MSWNPLGSSSGPGYYSCTSRRNKKEDLSKIFDLRDLQTITPGNQCEFPDTGYVLNLDNREDRWESFQRKNSELFKDLKIERFSATEGADRKEAIFESFLNCMRNGFENNESIIIFEDDCYLVPGAMEKIKKAWMDLPQDWDCLIGNHYLIYGIDILTDNLAKPRLRASTVNFSIFRKSILEKTITLT
jgi:hypothetical protein